MTETKPTRTARRGRIFPEIQWNEEQKARYEEEREAFYQHCKLRCRFSIPYEAIWLILGN